MVDPVGATGLSIAIVVNGINVLKFIYHCVDNSKHYGEDVRSLKTNLATEIARLEALSGFLSQKTAAGGSRFEQLSGTFQRAAKGMIQELHIKLAAYTQLVEKYSIKDLERGLELSLPSALDFISIEDTAELKNAGDMEAKERQENASLLSAGSWGLFRKKKVSALLSDISKWNIDLQQLLLCSLLFGNGPAVAKTTPVEIWQGLRLSNSISLQRLIAESTQAPFEMFHWYWVLKPSKVISGTDLDTRVQELVKDDETIELVFVEFKSFELRRNADGPSKVILGRLKGLVELLSQPNAAQSGFNTLQCIGVVEQNVPQQRTVIKKFAFVFRLPTDDPKADLNLSNLPINLKSAITSSTERRPTLGERFKLAYTLAQTVFQLHSVDWVHKSIRSENILLPRKASQISYSIPYLVGFEFSRIERERSTTERDDILERDIYRHPDRQGQPEDRFMVLHDIYALGVTLLEIGIWRPILGFEKHFGDMTAEQIKIRLELHARERLPHYMGGAYTSAVLHCLQGTLIERPQEASDLEQPWGPAQREQVQVSFLENVLGAIDGGTGLL